MKLQSLTASALRIPFVEAFRHAGADRDCTQTIWMEARTESGTTGYGEGGPREYVSGERLSDAAAFLEEHRHEWMKLGTLKDLSAWVDFGQLAIDRHPSAWTAVELALLDAIRREAGQSLEAALGLPELCGIFSYSAVLGDGDALKFERQLARSVRQGFRNFKIKLSNDRERDRAKVAALRRASIGAECVRADANNLWTQPEEAAAHLHALAYAFAALEEPLQAGDFPGMERLGQMTGIPVVLDESILRVQQLKELPGPSGQWIVYLRVSKMGGVIRSLKLVQAARQRGLRMIAGAHVGETSVLTRAGLLVAHAAREGLIAQEGAFGTLLLTRDIVGRSLMFGAGGDLDVAATHLIPNQGTGLLVQPTAEALGPLPIG